MYQLYQVLTLAYNNYFECENYLTFSKMFRAGSFCVKSTNLKKLDHLRFSSNAVYERQEKIFDD